MNGISITVARPEDAEAMLGIYWHYVVDTAVTFEIAVPGVDEFRERIRHTLERYPWLAALDSGTVIGYAYAGTFKARAAYDRSAEVSIYLHQDARGKGTGRMLYERLEHALAKQGVTNAYACITCTDRLDDPFLDDSSVRFHEKMGYSLVGTFDDCGYKFNRWYSMCWMQKMLGEHVAEPAPFVPFPEI